MSIPGVDPAKLPANIRKALNVDDLRDLARRRLPQLLFEFLDRGVDDDLALRRNSAELQRLTFVPRVFRNVSSIDTSTMLFGKPSALPLGIGATGAASLFWHEGDVLLARAAKAAGVPFMISGATLMPIEDIAAVGGRIWFQHYPLTDRDLSYERIDSAAALGCEALVITVDTAVMPFREYLVKLGFGIPVPFTVRTALDVIRKPAWLRSVYLPALLGDTLPKADPRRVPVADTLDWDEIAALRSHWKGKLILKGIAAPADAVRAIDAGCDGLIVSNHGGRNLDCSIPPIRSLPRILDAVGGRCPVMYDGGVRRGADVVKALALGADFAFAGRAALYGLSAGGEPGAALALEMLRQQIVRVMALCGCRSIADLTPELIDRLA